MFGDLMGNMQEKQAELQKKLKTVVISEEIEGIKVEANALREILNISLPENLTQSTDKEELEDLLIVAINNVLTKAAEEEAKQSQSLLSDLLPPGMGNLLG